MFVWEQGESKRKNELHLELGNHKSADRGQLGIIKNGSLSLDTHCSCVYVCVSTELTERHEKAAASAYRYA